MLVLFGDVISKKNGKRILRNKKSNKPFIASKEVYKIQENDYMYQLLLPKNKKIWNEMLIGKTYPVYLSFFFYRATKRAFDYNNISQGICDCLVKSGYLPEDNMNFLNPVFLGWEIDKINPRVELQMIDKNTKKCINCKCVNCRVL